MKNGAAECVASEVNDFNAGCYDDMIVETWRPILPTSEMRRYFIGGTPELEDLSYCGGSNSMATDSNVLSRYISKAK